MKDNLFKRICSGLLAVIMLLSVVPVPGYAQDDLYGAVVVEDGDIQEIPGESALVQQPELGEEPEADPTPVTSAQELEDALAAGAEKICITADFTIDRTFYITGRTVIYTEEAHTLTRGADFGGDIFVVGEAADGTVSEEMVVLLLGNPESDAQNLLTIDGNSANMSATVVGTVLFICGGDQVNLYPNVTIANCTKTGNERTLTTTNGVSNYPELVGGAAGIVTDGAALNIYGGNYRNLNGNDDTASWYGGAFFNHGTMKVYGGLFENCHAGRAGVFYNYRKLYLYNAEIKNNSAASTGGVIYTPNTSGAYLYAGTENDLVEGKVLISGNTAANAGAIYACYNVHMENVTFDGNTATEEGGAVIMANVKSTDFTNVVFKNNSAATGGAMYVSSPKTSDLNLSLIQSVFENNTATGNGGALYLGEGITAYTRQTDFKSNSGSNGGAIYVSGAVLEMNIGDVTGNTSSGTGGALMLKNVEETVDGATVSTGADVTLNRVNLSENSATGNGGALYSLGSKLKIYNSTVASNTSNKNGGAMYLYTGAESEIYNTTFDGNTTATSGGAAQLYSATSTLFHSCIFRNNTAANGGALQVASASVADLYDCQGLNNTAPKGGFVYYTATGTILTVSGLTVQGNTSTDGGDIFWSNSSYAKMYINKTNYTDLDVETLDEAYWSALVTPKSNTTVKMYEVDTEVPAYTDYLPPAHDPEAPNQPQPEPTEPAETEPKETEPKETEPKETEPKETEPKETEPKETEPKETEPKETEPKETEPKETEPKETEPKETEPKETEPKETEPKETEPKETEPKETEPKETEPKETEPKETEPKETEPKETEPKETEPKETEPKETEPKETEPKETEPKETEPKETEPKETEPKETEPKETEPKETEPEATEATEVVTEPTEPEVVPPQTDITKAAHAEHLEASLAAGVDKICITADFKIDRTFYITHNVTIYTEEAHTLTRAKDFAGDIFVVGEAADGTATTEEVVLTLGDPASDVQDLLTIDGNSEKMTVDVVGTVIFVCRGDRADLYPNVTIANCTKVGNERVKNEPHVVSYPDRVGGAAGILVEGAAMNIYGGNYRNLNGQTGSASDYGGAFYNYGTLRVYGGLFENCQAARAGIFYNYRKLYLYKAEIKNNTASYGGAIYCPNSTGAFLYVGLENDVVEGNVLFSGNTATSYGGAIYACYDIEMENVTFDGNSSATGGAVYLANIKKADFTNAQFRNNTADDGGALCVKTPRDANAELHLSLIKTRFENNTAKENGGALYLGEGIKAYTRQTDFVSNTASLGGAIYAEGAVLEMNIGEVSGNTSSGSGGAMYLASASEATLNEMTLSRNTSGSNGGAVYAAASKLTVYNSMVKNNNSTGKNGGAMYLATDTESAMYNTTFHGNYVSDEAYGGAMYIYTGANNLFHSCTFSNNRTGTEGTGGALQISNKSNVSLFNCEASNNSARKGGFTYYTVTGTTITIRGLTVFGNTATEAGPIFWSNSAGAKLKIDKDGYTDLDAGTLDEAYWSALVAGKPSVTEVDTPIPEYTDYLPPAHDPAAPNAPAPEIDVPELNVGDVRTPQELEDALAAGQNPIRIAADLVLDRTFYITRNVTLYTDESRVLTRAPEFTGDLFVVGQPQNARAAGGNVVLTLGDEVSTAKDMLIIDGNSANMTEDVVGTVLNLGDGGHANIHENVTFRNNKTAGNGAVARLSETAAMNVYGGSFRDNTAAGNGGAISSEGTVNVFGGSFAENEAENGGAIHNRGKLNIDGGSFAENTAASGGAVSSTGKLECTGGDFTGNKAENGGAMFLTGRGAASSAVTGITIEGNSASRNGGALCLTDGASVILEDVTLRGNRATNGGGLCLEGSAAQISGSDFDSNISDYYGGGIALYDGSNAVLTEIEATGNSAVYSGGFLYNADSAAQIRDSRIANSASDRTGGALSVTGSSDTELMNTALEGNEAATDGGAIYAAAGSNLSADGVTAKDNRANNGSVLFETGNGTEVTMDGLTVENNEGTMISGGSDSAVLNINKDNYQDLSAEGTLDDSYWAETIAGKLTVSEIVKPAPEKPDDGMQEEKPETPSITDAYDVASAAALEGALRAGKENIRITKSFAVDRTYFITYDVTIFSTEACILTRDPNFGSDIFVVGEDADGKTVLNGGKNVRLVLGDPASSKKDMLVIDGNRDNMQVKVDGSVLFISSSASVDLHENITIQNTYKEDNVRAIASGFNDSVAARVGGSMAIILNGYLNVYGGTYRNNQSLDENVIPEATKQCSLGGAIFNWSNLTIYGGTFENNRGARGAVVYNYHVIRIYGGTFRNNYASTAGGVIYGSSSASVHTYIGSEAESAPQILFENNTSKKTGGAIYSGALAGLMVYGNCRFAGNTSETSNGGAIYTSGQMMLRDCEFVNNHAYSKGGAVYLCNDSNGEVTRFVEVYDSKFEGNSAMRGGAVCMYASVDTLPEGGIASFEGCTFTKNVSSRPEGSSTVPQGGAMYVGRKSRLTLNDCSFRNNTSTSEAGAMIVTSESSVTVNNSTFSGNTSDGNSGAISVRSAKLTMDGVTMEENYADGNGAALYISYNSNAAVNSTVKISNSDFNSNTADGYGAAIYATKHAIDKEHRILSIYDSNFYLNSAKNGAGAIALMGGSDSYFSGLTFLQNSLWGKEAKGGAIYCGSSTFELDDGIFTQNSSSYIGGAIAIEGKSAKAVLNRIIGASNKASSRAGFVYTEGCNLTVYNSSLKNNSSGNGGVLQALDGAVTKFYDTLMEGNSASNNGGAIYAYTNGGETLLQNCTLVNNTTTGSGGAVYASNASVVSLYNNTYRNNSANYGGIMYLTTAGTTVTVNGADFSGNTATKSSPYIHGNNQGSILNVRKDSITDADAPEVLDDAYWSRVLAGKCTLQEIDSAVPDYTPYKGTTPSGEKPPVVKEPVPVTDVLDLGKSSSDEDIDATYAALPKLDNSSNFMSRNVTTFDNINGGPVTVDTFVSYKNKADGNGQVGLGLLIYQAILYKEKYPNEEVTIDVSAYRFSTQCAVNINRNSRYFGYMRDLQDREYDEYGFVRIAYLLVTAAKMGIRVTAIGQLDGYPRVSSALNIKKYFTYKLNDPCDPAYADGVIGDYMNFQFCNWTLDEKGGTDMMHTKMCAVSHYLDMNGEVQRNAVWTSSSNIDGIKPGGYNANNNIQTSTIVTGHADIFRITTNYLRLIADYCGQEDILAFQDIVSKRSKEQIDLIQAGKGKQIAASEQIVYLGTEKDDVFELYFTPLGGGSNVWDTTYNPYCKYIQEMRDSEDYILFTWGVPTYTNKFSLGRQIEDAIIAAFHENKNPKNKIYVIASIFDTAAFDDLEVGVDIGYKSFNKKAFGGIHNKDVQVSYVKDGQRYFVTIHNSLNFHSGSISYQSNFFLVVKEKTCAEDSVFSAFANLTTSGDIAAHTFGEWVRTKEPTATEFGEEVRSCELCGHEERRRVDQSGNPIDPTPDSPDAVNPFEDVTNSDYFYEPVLWALQNKITTGLDATHFGPEGACTRGQAVTFLWRAAGEPAPKSQENPFRDVSSDAYYYNAVLWAVESGITNGMGADTFAPDATCTRGQIVTFLWRYGNCPEPASSENPFTDADVNGYYGKAMLWAVENGITNGTGATTFAPDATCTRGQIVTFLYRAVG